MIELAPHHKIGLNLSGPVMIAAGFGGYGDAYRQLVDLSVFGAVVTQPITLRPQKGSPQPRLAEAQAGYILNTGWQNPGVKRVLRQYGRLWPRLGVPVIAHLPAADPDDLMRTARALAGADALAAIELGIPPDAAPQDVADWVGAVQEGCELPLLAKLPPGAPPHIAQAAAHNYVDALVVGASPWGASTLPTGKIVTGPVYGPALHNFTLLDIQPLTDFGLPLVAAGGIHSTAHIEAFLQAGATAVQLDSLLFIDPQHAEKIARAAAG